jgi:hypothetical protein
MRGLETVLNLLVEFFFSAGLDGDEEGNATTWEFELPDNLVKDSERIFVRASGDILGPSLSVSALINF